jgi:hypothetical protein
MIATETLAEEDRRTIIDHELEDADFRKWWDAQRQLSAEDVDKIALRLEMTGRPNQQF